MASEFPKKYSKKINPEFMDSVQSMKEDEIKQRILTSEQHLWDIEEAASKDEKLQAAKEAVKNFGSSYKESKGIETAKLKYCLFILESRGINLVKD